LRANELGKQTAEATWQAADSELCRALLFKKAVNRVYRIVGVFRNDHVPLAAGKSRRDSKRSGLLAVARVLRVSDTRLGRIPHWRRTCRNAATMNKFINALVSFWSWLKSWFVDAPAAAIKKVKAKRKKGKK